MNLKLQHINEINNEFDEQTQQLKQSKNNLKQVNIDIDNNNNELNTIINNINNAKYTLEQSVHTSMDSDSINLHNISLISSPEQPRALSNIMIQLTIRCIID